MKKCIITIALSFVLGLSIFAQASRYSRFEGTWTGNDDSAIIHCIFKNDNLIMIDSSTGEIIVGVFTYSERVISFQVKCVFMDSNWVFAPDGESVPVKMEYVFSGDSLIIVNNGDPLSVKKIE